MNYKRLLVLFILIGFGTKGYAQNKFKVFICDSTTKEKIFAAAVVVNGTSIGSTSDTNGIAILNNVPNGKQEINCSFLGYKKFSVTLIFPLKNPNSIFRIALIHNDDDDLAEVTVSSTRTNSRIEDLPLKVEVIGAEDVAEEASINPSSIAEMITDLAGVHLQQTSVSSGNVTPKLLGLDEKYVQILRDGLPLYEGFSGGFGLLQLPPMDVKQIEIIKGPASTLYGGGAISGIINIISKTPQPKPELTATLFSTTKKEGDANIYYAQRFNKFGITLFAGNTTQQYDASNGFTVIPQLQSNLIHPSFFWYINNKTTFSVGFSSTFETRTGGNVNAINNPVHGDSLYYEQNKINRNTADIHFEKIMDNKNVFTIKGSASKFNRDWQTNYYLFNGSQLSEYGEVNYLIPRKNNNFVIGANYVAENFTRNQSDSATNINNFSNYTIGGFVQDDWTIGKFTSELGLREDFQNHYGTFLLPHVAILYKINPAFSIRTGIGLGYTTPDILSYDLTSDEYKDYYLHVIPINNVTPESSKGGNFDINYQKSIGDALVTLTQSFFYTQIVSPIILNTDLANGTYYFSNASATTPFITEGSETYLRINSDDLDAYIGYTFDFTQRKYYPIQPINPLTPKNNFETDIVYSIGKNWSLGLETAFTDVQYLDDNSKVPSYWRINSMIEKKFKSFSIVLDGENLTNLKQTKYGSLVTGNLNNPGFKSVWEPLQGRVLSLAIRIKII